MNIGSPTERSPARDLLGQILPALQATARRLRPELV
jgi:hypothetical protein